MLADALTLPTLLALAMGGLAWFAAVGLLGFGAVLREGRGRLAFAVAALVNVAVPPIALLVGLLSLRDHAAMFGAESMALIWLVKAAPAWAGLELALAATAALTAVGARPR